MSSFGDDLKAALEQKGVSQAELARRIGVSPQYISQLVNGNRDAAERSAREIAAALHLPPERLGNFKARTGPGARHAVALTGMQGIEVAYLNVAIEALHEARRLLLRKSPYDALRGAAGKSDTHMFDAIAQNTIVDKLRAFNEHCAIFTEEGNVPDRREFVHNACFFIDPFDRSSPFATVLRQSDCKYISDLVDAPTFPMRGLMAPYGSITFVRESLIVFNVMLNYAEGDLYVACKSMRKHMRCDGLVTAEKIALNGTDVRFGPREGSEFVCFLGEEGSEKRGLYEEHLANLAFRPDQLPPRGHQAPGGPARILYLADDPDLAPNPRVACILSNGEKICEWLGWLAFASHSEELVAYEMYARKFSSRDEILLAPPPNYSLFTVADGKCDIVVERLIALDRPVFYRGAVVVTHSGSTEVTAEMRASLTSRELNLYSGRR